MTRNQAVQKRQRLSAKLSGLETVLRGSLLQRTVRHSSGCPKCASGGGHPLWVLNVAYPGGKTRQISIRPHQVKAVREAIGRFHEVKHALEAISEVNQFLLRMDRTESKDKERQP